MKSFFSPRIIFALALFVSSSAFAYAQTADSTAITLEGVPIVRSLSFGIQGEDVAALQTFLRGEGFFTYPASTGFFGPITRDAVMAFQAAHGVPAIGVVGPMTRNALNTIQLAKAVPPTSVSSGSSAASESNDPPKRRHRSRGGSSSSNDDDTAPVITSVATSSVAQTSITITWTTDEAADTQVEYGITSSYGSSSTLDASLVTSHTVNLTGLSAGTTYHFRVRSVDSEENDAYSADYTFTTVSAVVAYEAGAVHFDGATSLALDSLTINPTPYLFMSVWIKESESAAFADNEYSTIFASDPGEDITPSLTLNSPTFGFYYGAQTVAGGTIFNAHPASPPTNTSGTWNHYILAADLSGDATQFALKLYKNGVDITTNGTAGTGSGDAGNITLNGLALTIGFDGYANSDSFYYEGDMADLYLTSENLFTGGVISPATIAKFRDADGKPVDLGADGSAPTGTAPAIYLHHEAGEAASGFADNLGTGGDFDIEGSALTEAGTTPSD